MLTFGKEELSCRFVLMHLPGIKVKVLQRFFPFFCFSFVGRKLNFLLFCWQVFEFCFLGRKLKFSCQEIEDMIITVDKNQDGKISYSEFRVG